MDTALNFGLDLENSRIEITPFPANALYRPDDADAARFLLLVDGWIRLNALLNEMSRSMGQNAFYPFVLSAAVVAKLQFIHMVVGDRAHAAVSPA